MIANSKIGNILDKLAMDEYRDYGLITLGYIDLHKNLQRGCEKVFSVHDIYNAAGRVCMREYQHV